MAMNDVAYEKQLKYRAAGITFFFTFASAHLPNRLNGMWTMKQVFFYSLPFFVRTKINKSLYHETKNCSRLSSSHVSCVCVCVFACDYTKYRVETTKIPIKSSSCKLQHLLDFDDLIRLILPNVKFQYIIVLRSKHTYSRPLM